MKITKHKKTRKYMSFYINNFGFREPLLVLIDGSFCHAAYKVRLQIEEQLKKYFQCEVKPIVTACIITETDNLGPAFVSTSQLLKKFLVHRCGHEKQPVDGAACIKAMTKTCHYIVATQDRALQEWVRGNPGIPLFYLHNASVPTLVQPSEAHRQAAADGQKSRNGIRELDKTTIQALKVKEGLVPAEPSVRKKPRKPKNPNPLSCKKPKKKKTEPGGRKSESDGATPAPVDGGVVKKKSRKRIKLPKHVIEHLKATNGAAQNKVSS
ncbi:rRNA-processing protein UTP23 homolog [Anopheles stephensi]|uniref:rRNA-processing protein UTP23 homolog n=1 Tax=Anopheles stephensi TaxID=30069 RepID=UPI00165883F7|nr:rRNA-processing protein UTP23 homolog [Anopheles stephensi]